MPRKKAAPVDTNGHDTSMAHDGDADASTAGPSSSKIPASVLKQMDTQGIEQFELPKAVVTRVAKAELPDNVQIRKDALLAISKSSTIFISYLSAVSDELAKQGSRKTITTKDVLDGLKLMDFPADVRERVKREVGEYKKSEADKKAGSAAKGTTIGGDGEEGEDEEEAEEGAGRVDLADTTGLPQAATGNGDDDLEAPPAQPAGERDVDEQDEDTEQRMVEEGAEEGNLEDEEMGDDT